MSVKTQKKFRFLESFTIICFCSIIICSLVNTKAYGVQASKLITKEMPELTTYASSVTDSVITASVSQKVNMVVISGKINSDKAVPIAVRVLDEQNKLVYINQFKSNSNGEFTECFDFGNQKTGQYTVKLNTNGLEKPVEKIFSFILHQIKEFKPLKDEVVILGSKYTSPQTVKAIFDDGSEQDVEVTWDNTVDTQKTGTVLLTGTVEGTSLKITLKVDVLTASEFAAAKVKTLEESVSNTKNLVDSKQNSDANAALKEAEEALSSLGTPDKGLKDRFNAAKAAVELGNKVKVDLDTYIEVGSKDLSSDKEYSDFIKQDFIVLADLKLNLNSATRAAVNNIRNAVVNSARVTYEYKNKIAALINANKAIDKNNYKSIKTYENAYALVADLNNKGMNEASQKSLEAKRDNDKKAAEEKLINALKVIQGADSTHIKVIFAGTEVTNLSSKYEISVDDINSYGVKVFVGQDGNVTLNNDKGENAGKTYFQIINIKNLFWNLGSRISVIITDGPGMDTIEIGGRATLSVKALEKAVDDTKNLVDSKLNSDANAALKEAEEALSSSDTLDKGLKDRFDVAKAAVEVSNKVKADLDTYMELGSKDLTRDKEYSDFIKQDFIMYYDLKLNLNNATKNSVNDIRNKLVNIAKAAYEHRTK